MSIETRRSLASTNNKFLRLTSWFPVFICALGLVLGSCSSSSTGSDSSGNGGGNENPIGTEPTFTNVQQIFQQSCSGSNCHINQRTNNVRLDTYQNVIESRGTEYGKDIIQPGNAEGSPLVDKIEPNPDIPPRMPQGGNFLSDERIDQIRTWIDNGAKNN
ncbi:hypothetical protein LX73_0474 [Fodinibius salinus]|uniref:Planctomycete cytochrome C n=1 Tax=Fodinibius salinus TaxID=860790 RepID=A0A5D3YPL3_9BACT|nr:hypothetical protein [Fodinibius salinus]TYP95178.1 hypothetical protein LX73_0474 [Fodinibius salinus]